MKKLKYIFFGGNFIFTGQEPFYSHLQDSNNLLDGLKNIFSMNIPAKWTGSNYGLFRIDALEADNKIYRNLIYTKIPLIILQYEDKCVFYELELNKNNRLNFFTLAEHNNEIELIIKRISGNIKEKETIHLSKWQKISKINIDNLDEVLVNKNESSDKWYDITENFLKQKIENIELEKNNFKDYFLAGYYFLNRTFDALNNMHCEFIHKLKPDAYFKKRNYCLTSYELHRLKILSRIFKSELIENPFYNIKAILDNIIKNSVEYIEDIDLTVVYNSIGIKNNKVYYHNEYSMTFTGYPGGLADFIIYLKEIIQINKFDKNEYKEIFEKLKNTLYKLELENRLYPSGIYISKIEEEEQYINPKSSPKIYNISASSRVAEAFICLYEILEDNECLQRAENIIEILKPKAPYYIFRGFGTYLDANALESDCISAVNLTSAVLKLYKYKKIDNINDILKSLLSYISGFIYLYDTKSKFYIDPLTDSFSPRIGLFDTLLASKAFKSAGDFLNNSIYRKISRILLNNVLKFQKESLSGGISESVGVDLKDENFVYLDFENGITSFLMESILNEADLTELKTDDTKEKSDVYDFDISYNIEYKLDLKKQYKEKLKNKFYYKILRYIYRKTKNIINKEKLYKKQTDSKLDNIEFTRKGVNPIDLKIRIGSNENLVIDKFYFPVIEFKQEIKSIDILERINKRIKKISVNTADGKKIIIDFNIKESSSLPGEAEISDNRIIFDSTLSGLWNNNGIVKYRCKVV